MYNPTNIEKKVCMDIVKEILRTDNEFVCEQYVKEVFSITYSIGGDYNENTLRKVAQTIIKK